MDSLGDLHFKFDGSMEELHAEIERQLKEKDIAQDDLERVHHQLFGRKIVL